MPGPPLPMFGQLCCPVEPVEPVDPVELELEGPAVEVAAVVCAAGLVDDVRADGVVELLEAAWATVAPPIAAIAPIAASVLTIRGRTWVAPLRWMIRGIEPVNGFGIKRRSRATERRLG